MSLFCATLARAISLDSDEPCKDRSLKLWAVPRGGIPVMYRLMASLTTLGFSKVQVVDNPDIADYIIDDIIDSGATMRKYEHYKGAFCALVSKRIETEALIGVQKDPDVWVVFPWEDKASSGIEDNIVRLLQYCGEDSSRGGLLETPKRVAKAWEFWTSGYDKKAEDILKCFEDGAENCDEMVIVKDIPFYTHCEHHMAPFFGTATIAYIPNGKIVGLSKLSRLLDMFARRLQVQERLTNQVADSLMEHLEPLGCAVQLKARHMCMESRGVCQQGHHTVSQALRGVMKEQGDTRAEFLSIANS